MDKNSISNFFRKDGKRLKADLIAIFVTGMMLVIMGNIFLGNKKTAVALKADENKEEMATDENYEDLEGRMSSVFSSIYGVGSVQVMITYKAGNEIIIAEEEKSRNGSNETSVEKTAVILSQGGGVETPLVLKEKKPEIEGVVIVAQGGDNILVKESLSRGAQALLNVPAHKVEVFKMEK